MKRIVAYLVILVLVLSMAVPVCAHEGVDLSKTGSLTVQVKLDTDLTNLGTLTLYRVATVLEQDGNFSFEAVPELAAGNFDLSDLYVPGLAQAMKDTLDTLEAPLTGVTQSFAVSGETVSARFENLELGLYLAVQEQRASGYKRLEPFLVSVPYYMDGAYVYDVDTLAKPELEREPDPTDPTKPTDPDLPQTGQLNWPVPVLAVLGLGLFAMGWVLCFAKRKANEE